MNKEELKDLEKKECSVYRKRSYTKPILLPLNNTGANQIGHNVHSHQTFEGGSYPTTHGPS